MRSYRRAISPAAGREEMADDTIDLFKNYLLLEPDGEAVSLPGGGEFWRQLMSGDPADAGIRRLMDSKHGRLFSALDMDRDWTNWEMHPAGDEVLVMLQGSVTFRFEEAAGAREIELSAGHVLIVPRGVWHTARVRTPAKLLAITAGRGTEHRPA
jgi:mannose-6-phosphate isomerase-like protein (cupin superfamily)